MTPELPIEHRALVLQSIEAGFEIRTVPTPRPTHGSAVIRVLAAGIVSYAREIYNGERHYDFPTPLVPGFNCIGRIAALGPDAASLEVGQLVYVDCVIRGRDDPGAVFLSAINEGGSAGSRKLMRDVWRDGPCAEFTISPLENCIPLNEEVLCNDLGYSFETLMYLSNLLVPYGGLRDIGVEPGDTVVICPATGGFGGAGVLVARAMGARVIAMGRNSQKLLRLQETTNSTMPGGRVETVQITRDEEADATALKAFGTIDKILDLSPPTAADSTHMKSALKSLKYEGQVSLMGLANVTSSPAIRWSIIGNNITLKGKLMYTRKDMLQFVQMLEKGMLPKGSAMAQPKVFGLEQWKEGLDVATEWTGLGKCVVFKP